jgi:deazaflavin-dependent oxidoreductase (nitroreductase family)
MVEYDYVTKKREEVQAFPERGMGFIRMLLRGITHLQVAVFRATKGRMMNKFIGGFPVCIVTTTGAKSGAIRRIALIHLPHGDDKLLVASQGGMDKMPAWYYNIAAHPDVRIMVDGEEKAYRAARVSDEEKAELWPHLCSLYPDFDEYQARTDRNIPVFRCTAVSPV